MSDSHARLELRQSVSLLATEWWLLVGVVAGYVLYGVWVVATGIALGSVAPSLATTVTTVGSTAVTAGTLVAAVLWLAVPALVVTRLLDRQLSNTSGNLVDRYRINHPGVLPALPGVLALLFAAAAVAVGPSAPVVALGAVASIHLLVRTLAFGRRVYSFSPSPLFPVLTALSSGSLAAAWLVHTPVLPEAVGRQAARAGVGPVVETAIAGTTPATALGVLVAVPALLSGSYLAVQALVAYRVRARAPLANPTKRGEQRYPIMPPVPNSERPGVSPSTTHTEPDDTGDESTTESDDEAETDTGDEPTAEPGDEATHTDGSDDKSQTRVFTSPEPVPDDGEMTTRVAAEAEADETDDGWIDDTDIFSADRDSGDEDECTACGEALPDDASVTFCPNCGQKI